MGQLPTYLKCIVCGRENHRGLNIRFRVDGSEIRSEVPFNDEFCGFKDVVHGGILTAVLDEAMGWAAGYMTKRMCHAAEMTIRFVRPVHAGERVEVPETAATLVEGPRPGLVVQSDGGVTVGLDTAVDENLRLEGIARDLVNRIQRLRRDAGLELDDRIRLGIFGGSELASAALAHSKYIAGEVLAVDVEVGSELPGGEAYEHTQQLRLEGREALIAIRVIR